MNLADNTATTNYVLSPTWGDLAMYARESIHTYNANEDTCSRESGISQRTREFLTKRPDQRQMIADLVRFDLAAAADLNDAVREILITASEVRVHDRLAIASDLMVLLRVDLLSFLYAIGVRSALSGLWTLNNDAQFIVLQTLARQASPEGIRLIAEASEFGKEESRVIAMDAALGLDDTDKAIAILVARQSDPDTPTSIRRLAVEYLDELIADE